MSSAEDVFKGLMGKLGVGAVPKEEEVYIEDQFLTDTYHLATPAGKPYLRMDVRVRPQFGKSPALCIQLAQYPDMQIMLDAQILEQLVDNMLMLEADFNDWDGGVEKHGK